MTKFGSEWEYDQMRKPLSLSAKTRRRSGSIAIIRVDLIEEFYTVNWTKSFFLIFPKVGLQTNFWNFNYLMSTKRLEGNPCDSEMSLGLESERVL